MKTMIQAACGAAALLSVGCGGGAYEPFHDVTTSYKDDGRGTLLEVAAVVSKAALEEVHTAKTNAAGDAEFSDVVKAESVFDHVGFDYNASGHGPPGVNDIPHVDAHFNFFTLAQRDAIDCEAEPTPDADQVPEGVQANVNPEPFGGCVKKMGGHGALPYEKLTADMIYGYHDGKLSFVEPMIDVQKLLDEEEIELDILAPAKLHYDGVYPTRFFMRYTDDAYEFVLTDFIRIE